MIENEDGTFTLDDSDEVMLMTLNASFRCSCCKPSRQIYYRSLGRLTAYYHERDHTSAKRRGVHIGYEGGAKPPPAR